jgi:hypothetical protein
VGQFTVYTAGPGVIFLVGVSGLADDADKSIDADSAQDAIQRVRDSYEALPAMGDRFYVADHTEGRLSIFDLHLPTVPTFVEVTTP